MKLSVVILTKNEEDKIVSCLESVLFADEIIIVDDYSTDTTFEKIESFDKRLKRIKIFRRHVDDDFSSQRNFGLSKAENEYVLFLDADEQVSKKLKTEIITSISQNTHNNAGWFISRQDIFLNKKLKYGETANVKFVRLGKKDKGKWKGFVHETWDIEGKLGRLNYSIDHYSHTNLSGFIKKVNYYSTLAAKQYFQEKVKVSFIDIIVFPIGKFLQNYFLRFGFKDNVHGFIMAIMMSLHSFLVRAKLWEYQRKY